MKALVATFCLFVITVNIFAFAVLDVPKTAVQPDDTKILLFISGDEFHSWAYQVINNEKYTIVKDTTTGYWCWAMLNKKGELTSTRQPVHLSDPRSLRLAPNINISNEKYQELREPFDTMLENTATRSHTNGVINNIVIFVKFLDDNDFELPISYYDDLLNNYNATPASLKRYYYEQSYGKLTVNSYFPLQGTTENIVAYQAPNDREYYLQHSSMFFGVLKNSIALNRTTIQNYLIEHDINIDYDGDGYVDNIIFIVKGDAYGSSLWSQAGNFSESGNSNVLLRGSHIEKYNINMGGHIEQRGVSVIAHEFGHTLSLPDFQGSMVDTVAVHAVQNWCLMGLVPFSIGNIKNPASILMYNKYKYCKWIDDIPTINTAGTYTLHPNYANYPNAGHERAYRIYPTHSIDEHYIVEYRRKTDSDSQYFDPYIDDIIWGSGMLIYKVNTTKRGNSATGNHTDYEIFIYRPSIASDDTSNPLYPVDPNYDSITPNSAYTEAHYSANVGRTEINDNTIPCGRLSDGSLGGLNVSNIGYATDTIQFTVSFTDTLYAVPGSFSTIQEAINAAQSGQRSFIDISGGIYNEDLEIDRKDLIIRGVTPDVVINGYITVTRAPSIVEFNNLKFTTPSANYSITLTNSNAKINNVEFDLANTAALGAITAQSSFGRRDVIEISNSVFSGKHAINYITTQNSTRTPALLKINNSHFTQNIRPGSTMGNAIHFQGSNIDITNSQFYQEGLSVDGSTIDLVFYSSIDTERTLNLLNSIFQTTIDTDVRNIVPSDISIQTRYLQISANIERNIFNTINNLQCEVSNFTKINFSEISSNKKPSIILTNNTDIVTSENDITLYGNYNFLKHIGRLIAKNNIITGSIIWGNSTGVKSEIRNNCLVPPHATVSTDRLTSSNNINVAPQIDPLTFKPIWNSMIKSPLIDAGYAGADSTSNNWIENPEYIDSDKTRIDIGAFPAQWHGAMRYIFKSRSQNEGVMRNAIYWVCFPYLDKLFQGTVDGHPADGLEYNLNIYNGNNLFNPDDQQTIMPLNTIIWDYNNDQDSYPIGGSSGWVGNEPILHSRYGYKINMQGLKDADIIVSGFLSGFYIDNSDIITINAIAPSIGYRDILVGYFRTKPEYPLVALHNIVDKLIMIQTQRWAMCRASISDPWVSKTRIPMLNPGEAVTLRYIGNTTSSFRWVYAEEIENEEEEDDGTTGSFYSHPWTTHFDFEEQFNYIPLFIELSEDMQDDYNAEIGLFIDDVCYGSEVVIDDVIQINAYICELDIPDDAVVELKYYKYGSKSAGKAINEYRVRDIHDMSTYTSKRLDFNQEEQFYLISYRDQEDAVENVASVKTTLNGNYPNPFNPSTTIHYSLGEAGNVKISLYNIKGQLVRVLINETKEAGHHTVVWNGDDSRAKKVSSGIYFYRMETKASSYVKKMLLIK